MSRVVRTLPALAILALAAAMSAGCASYSRDHVIVGSVPDDYRTRHPIVVRQSEVTEDIVVSANAKSLSYRDRAVAEEFAGRFKRSGASAVAILIPSGSHNEAAARRIAHGISKVLTEKDIPARNIAIQHYAAAGHGDAATIRLAFADLTASVEGECGKWEEDLTDTKENRNYANFGCATQSNLAAMVANPADLLGPRGVSEIDATRRTTIIENWRTDGHGELPRLF